VEPLEEMIAFAVKWTGGLEFLLVGCYDHRNETKHGRRNTSRNIRGIRPPCRYLRRLV